MHYLEITEHYLLRTKSSPRILPAAGYTTKPATRHTYRAAKRHATTMMLFRSIVSLGLVRSAVM
ncbi:MAG TPA: hypothetical protein VNB90_16315 [Cytophagaceae bacterium]|nr:hypothetical protein [Cytophagaceae bacterium]